VRVLIVAFDGVLAHTLDTRTDAIMEAISDRRVWDAAMPAAVDRAQVRTLMPGRTLHEVLRLIAPTADDVTLDLCTMRAQQLVSARLAHGMAISADVCASVDRERVAGTRVVLRSDSARRDVESVLALTTLDAAFTLLRCADDPPGDRRGEPAIVASYATLARRLDARGMVVADRVAWESGAFAASAAGPHVGRVVVRDTVV
jgi:hypothetical protein